MGAQPDLARFLFRIRVLGLPRIGFDRQRLVTDILHFIDGAHHGYSFTQNCGPAAGETSIKPRSLGDALGAWARYLPSLAGRVGRREDIRWSLVLEIDPQPVLGPAVLPSSGTYSNSVSA